MPKKYHTYSRNCNYCGIHYEGYGEFYCSNLCCGKAKIQNLNVRFWSKVNIKSESECWEWKTGLNADGYGRFKMSDKQTNAHRIAWYLTYGEIPKGISILHICDNRSCCNPTHLFQGTQQDNIVDMVKKQRNAHNFGVCAGIKNAGAKLTEEQVIKIRALRQSGIKLKDLASMYKVHKETIYKIISRKTWKYI